MKNDISQVTLCYSPSGAPITSCEDSQASLVTNGNIVVAGAVPVGNQYSTVIYNTLPGVSTTLRDAGVSFSAGTLSTETLGPNNGNFNL